MAWNGIAAAAAPTREQKQRDTWTVITTAYNLWLSFILEHVPRHPITPVLLLLFPFPFLPYSIPMAILFTPTHTGIPSLFTPGMPKIATEAENIQEAWNSSLLQVRLAKSPKTKYSSQVLCLSRTYLPHVLVIHVCVTIIIRYAFIYRLSHCFMWNRRHANWSQHGDFICRTWRRRRATQSATLAQQKQSKHT